MGRSQPNRVSSEVLPVEEQNQLSMRARLELAVQICRRRPNLTRTTTLALIVGTCLVFINQLGPLLGGPRPIRLWLEIALDYLVPFVVSNLGVLSGSRNGSR